MNYAATHKLQIYVCKPVHQTYGISSIFKTPSSSLRRADGKHGACSLPCMHSSLVGLSVPMPGCYACYTK
jgi:hypothetical protein